MPLLLSLAKVNCGLMEKTSKGIFIKLFTPQAMLTDRRYGYIYVTFFLSCFLGVILAAYFIMSHNF